MNLTPFSLFLLASQALLHALPCGTHAALDFAQRRPHGLAVSRVAMKVMAINAYDDTFWIGCCLRYWHCKVTVTCAANGVRIADAGVFLDRDRGIRFGLLAASTLVGGRHRKADIAEFGHRILPGLPAGRVFVAPSHETRLVRAHASVCALTHVGSMTLPTVTPGFHHGRSVRHGVALARALRSAAS